MIETQHMWRNHNIDWTLEDVILAKQTYGLNHYGHSYSLDSL